MTSPVKDLQEIQDRLREHILDACGSIVATRVVYGARGGDLALPNISIFEIDDTSEQFDTHDGDSSATQTTWQINIHGKLPSDAATLFGLLRTKFSNKNPFPFQRTSFRGLSGYTEPEDNSHNRIAEIKGVYNVIS